jgi:hypothetical protein
MGPRKAILHDKDKCQYHCGMVQDPKSLAFSCQWSGAPSDARCRHGGNGLTSACDAT